MDQHTRYLHTTTQVRNPHYSTLIHAYIEDVSHINYTHDHMCKVNGFPIINHIIINIYIRFPRLWSKTVID